MSHQPNNEIRQTSTPQKQREHLPTETNASEQAVQELSEEQLADVTGGGFVGSIAKWGIKQVAKKSSRSNRTIK